MRLAEIENLPSLNPVIDEDYALLNSPFWNNDDEGHTELNQILISLLDMF